MKIDISKLHHDFRIDVKSSGSSDMEIKEMQDYFSEMSIPREYTDLISELTEIEILVRDDSYIRIWGAIGCIEMNESYHIQKYIPGALAIGDDEGGQVIFYALGNNSHGVYKIGFGNLDFEDAIFIADSLYELLMNGRGVDNLI